MAEQPQRDLLHRRLLAGVPRARLPARDPDVPAARTEIRPLRRRTHRLDREHARSHAERLAARDGYFAPESVIRRVGNTPVTPFLGGGTAVLLQVAHPLVAAGVAAHSDYRNDLWRRLATTLRVLYLITYGTRAEADRAGASVEAVHACVRGTTGTELGSFPAGTPYSADDPELMLWVHATLVYASLAAYQRFEGPLSDDEQRAYYRDMKTVARLVGTPAEALPRGLADFRDYFDAQLSGDTLAVTPLAEDIAGVILKAPLPAPLRLLAPAHRLATAALLPPALRREFGLRWTPFHPPLLALAGGTLKVAGWPILRTASRLRLTPATA